MLSAGADAGGLLATAAGDVVLGASGLSLLAATVVQMTPSPAQTIEDKIKDKFQKVQMKLRGANSIEDVYKVKLDALDDMVVELKLSLDSVFFAPSELDDVPSNVKEQFRKLSASVAELVKQSTSVTPKIRKLCVSRGYGAKCLLRGGKMFKAQKRNDDALWKMLKESVANFDIPSAEIQVIMNEIGIQIERVAADMDETKRLMRTCLDSLKATAKASVEALRQRLATTSSRWEKRLVAMGSMYLVLAVLFFAVTGALPLAGVGCAGAGSLAVGCIVRSSRKHIEARQIQEAIDKAHLDENALSAKYQRWEDLMQKIEEAKDTLSSDRTGPGLSTLNGVLMNLMESVGIDTDSYRKQIADGFEESLLCDDNLMKQLQDYLIRNDKVLETVSKFEMRMINVLEVLSDRESPSQPMHIQVDTDKLMPRPAEAVEVNVQEAAGTHTTTTELEFQVVEGAPKNSKGQQHGASAAADANHLGCYEDAEQQRLQSRKKALLAELAAVDVQLGNPGSSASAE